MRHAIVLIAAIVGVVFGYFIAVGSFLLLLRDNFFAILFAIGPMGAAAGVLVAVKLVTSERSDAIRLVAALTLAAVIVEFVPLMLVIGHHLFIKPDDVSLSYAFVLVPMASVPGTIVLLLLGIWRRAKSWWDSVMYGGASAVALVVSATLLPAILTRVNVTVPSWTQATIIAIPGALAGFVFFAILRICRVNH